MARDLIPPPSPAGRASPDALPEAPPPARAEPEPAEAPLRESSLPAPFRGRFGFLTGALAGIAVCAAVAFGLLLAAGEPAGRVHLASNWSSWEPPTSDPGPGAAAIAAQVGRDYRRDAAHQLVNVSGGRLTYQGLPLSVALQPGDGTLRDFGSNGVVYTMDGLGANGRIAGGEPSPARHALLRREALELALYSFRYLDGIDEVITLLPPTDPKASAKKKAKPQEQAVFYRAGDLRSELERPLARTLAPGRLTPQSLTAADLGEIDRLTLRNLFLVALHIAPNAQAYLLLSRPGS